MYCPQLCLASIFTFPSLSLWFYSFFYFHPILLLPRHIRRRKGVFPITATAQQSFNIPQEGAGCSIVGVTYVCACVCVCVCVCVWVGGWDGVSAVFVCFCVFV